MRSRAGRPRDLALALLLLHAPAAAQERANDPAACPWCGGDPARLAAAGLVSHGGFEFAETDTRGVDELLPEVEILWLETEHLELGLALSPYKIKTKERKRFRAELTRLQERLPEVDPRTKVLDPWLRLHLYAMRLEDVYDGFLEIVRVGEDHFPQEPPLWMPGQPYRGEGPYLGQTGKYEVLVVPSAAQQVRFLRDQYGLGIRRTQIWNVIERGTLMFVANLSEEGIREDQHLWNHLAFTLTHLLVDGFEHYSYDTPLYLKEGLAHAVERRLSPDFNSYTLSEGGLRDRVGKADWDEEVAELVAKGAASTLARLVNLDSFTEFTAEDHLTSWSLTEFLLERYPEEYAALVQDLHGRKTEDGVPDGSRMKDRHREAVREIFGKSYAELDAEWREWARAR